MTVDGATYRGAMVLGTLEPRHRTPLISLLAAAADPAAAMCSQFTDVLLACDEGLRKEDRCRYDLLAPPRPRTSIYDALSRNPSPQTFSPKS